MKKILQALENIEVAIGEINTDPENSFGMRNGDELHEIAWRIALQTEAIDRLTAVVEKLSNSLNKGK
jgi:hypothetical protein